MKPTLRQGFFKAGWAFLLLLLLGFVIWVVRDIPLEQIVATLSTLSLGQIAALLAFNVMILLLFNSRWWLILRVQGHRAPYFSLLGYRQAAFAISYFSPGTQFGGEPLQVYLLQNRLGVPGPAALATVTLDKLFELLANFTFLAAGVVLVVSGGYLGGLARLPSLLAAGGLLALPLAYLLGLWAGLSPLAWLLSKLPHRWSDLPTITRLGPLLIASERQVADLCRHKPRLILGVVLLSGLIWVLLAAEYWLALVFLGQTLTPVQAVIALTAARLAFLAPVPAGIGALEAGQVLAMQALGFPAALGIGASLLIRARDLTFGAVGLWWLSLLTRAAPPLEEAPSPRAEWPQTKLASRSFVIRRNQP